jgi:hypothetical protein
MAAMALAPGLATATTIVSITGAEAQGLALGTQVDAASWTSQNAYKNVTITADLQNLFESPFTGTAWIMTKIGSGANVTDQVATTSYSFIPPNPINNETVTLFDGLSLPAGTYYLVISGPASFQGLAWLSTDNPFAHPPPTPIITTDVGVVYGGDWVATASGAFLPASNFVGALPFDLIFGVSGTLAASPEPATFLTVGLALLGLVVLWNRRARAVR